MLKYLIMDYIHIGYLNNKLQFESEVSYEENNSYWFVLCFMLMWL